MDNLYLCACPSSFYISSGVGTSKYQLVAFDNALINAGVSGFNLVKVSSILPACCKQSDNVELKAGSLLPTAFATISSDVKGEQISSCVAVGIPENEEDIGVIMEYSGKVSKDEAENICQRMVIESMKNHNIPIKDIICSAESVVVKGDSFLSVVSVLSMW